MKLTTLDIPTPCSPWLVWLYPNGVDEHLLQQIFPQFEVEGQPEGNPGQLLSNSILLGQRIAKGIPHQMPEIGLVKPICVQKFVTDPNSRLTA